MANPSFDIVSKIELQEVNNAIMQAQKEIQNRYDFRGSDCEIRFEQKIPSITILAENELKMNTVIDILLTKMTKRSVPLKSLVYGNTEPTGKILQKVITVQQGLSKDQCKVVIQAIKKSNIKKAQAQIMDDQIRVSAKKKDDLQAIIQFLRNQNFNFDLQYNNFR